MENLEDLNTPVYCIKCKNFTTNVDPVVTKRETHHLKALCVVCDSKKNKFLKRNRRETQKIDILKPDTTDSDTPEQSDNLSQK
jgi:hypothetical protein